MEELIENELLHKFATLFIIKDAGYPNKKCHSLLFDIEELKQLN